MGCRLGGARLDEPLILGAASIWGHVGVLGTTQEIVPHCPPRPSSPTWEGIRAVGPEAKWAISGRAKSQRGRHRPSCCRPLEAPQEARHLGGGVKSSLFCACEKLAKKDVRLEDGPAAKADHPGPAPPAPISAHQQQSPTQNSHSRNTTPFVFSSFWVASCCADLCTFTVKSVARKAPPEFFQLECLKTISTRTDTSGTF